MTDLSASTYVKVWPAPVRIAHWGLALLVLVNLFNDSGGKVHRYVGYAAAAVALLRLLYGLVQRQGPAGLHIPSATGCLAHARAMVSGRVPRYRGHNPLAALMTLTLWTLVLLLASTGWISRWDMFWGEDWPQDVHRYLTVVLQVCVVVHLLGVVASSVLERQNLLAAMIHGRKRID